MCSTHAIVFCCVSTFVCPTLCIPYSTPIWRSVRFDACSMPIWWCMSLLMSCVGWCGGDAGGTYWRRCWILLLVQFFLTSSAYLIFTDNHVFPAYSRGPSLGMCRPTSGWLGGDRTWGEFHAALCSFMLRWWTLHMVYSPWLWWCHDTTLLWCWQSWTLSLCSYSFLPRSLTVGDWYILWRCRSSTPPPLSEWVSIRLMGIPFISG